MCARNPEIKGEGLMSAASASIWHIDYVHLALRMLLAAVLGGLVGIEREWSNHSAGFRTHILVCLGSATIMLLSIYGFSDFTNEANVRIDPARLAAQVISGIGFLGAGAIMRNGNMIKGLTTAASVWVVAAIGLCVGAGFYVGAFLCTLMALISLYILNIWEKSLFSSRKHYQVKLKIVNNPDTVKQLVSLLGELKLQIVHFNMVQQVQASEREQLPETTIDVCLTMKKHDKLMYDLSVIAEIEGVISMESQDMRIYKNKTAEAQSVSL